MATRSTIGIKNNDDSITFIYCHYDGYLHGVGKILKNHYTEEKKIYDLISLGAISSLGKEITPSSFHSFDSPQENVTVFYNRDRGEKEGVSSMTVKNIYEYETHFEEYNYLWENGKWFYQKNHGDRNLKYEL